MPKTIKNCETVEPDKPKEKKRDLLDEDNGNLEAELEDMKGENDRDDIIIESI